jgi:D-arginine dehydrogenase
VDHCDVVVVGAGIAGASSAWALAERHRVVLVEQEGAPGHHATGRSASVLSETVGHPVVCGLAAASRPFLTSPPPGFVDHPLLSPRGLLWIGKADDREALDRVAMQAQAVAPGVARLDANQVRTRVPELRAAWRTAGGVHEPDAMAIDVDALLHGFLRGLRARGGEVIVTAELTAARRRGRGWDVHAGSRRFASAAVVDAAGAWGDEVARRAGVRPLGLVPLRRTAALVPAPDAVRSWPLVMDVGGRFYCEPEPGGLLVSPADETPSEPCDAKAEELDVALAVERVAEATTVAPRSVRRAWAGLRTFAPDRVPVAGEDPEAPGFFWLVGQGGAGIKTSPALARVIAALVAGDPPPTEVTARGVTAEALSPARLR